MLKFLQHTVTICVKRKLSSLNMPQIYLQIQCTPGLVRIMTLQRCLCSTVSVNMSPYEAKGFADTFKVISLEDYPSYTGRLM